MSCQQNHHRKASFQDEYRDLLREHELLWDGSHPHRSIQYRPSMRPLQGRTILVPANQGSRPSLADYAPLGLSDSELWRTSHASTAMSLEPFNRIAAMPQSLASLYVHLVSSTTVRHPFLADRPIRSQAAGSDASSPNGA
jgi:hypothetical protein